MGRLIDFTGYTTNKLDPDEVLENNKGTFRDLIIIGYDNNDMEKFCGTYSDLKDIFYLIERFKLFLLRQAEGD